MTTTTINIFFAYYIRSSLSKIQNSFFFQKIQIQSVCVLTFMLDLITSLLNL